MSEDERAESIDFRAIWDDFCDRLRDSGHRALDAAPDDDFDRAEGLRYVARLARSFLGNVVADAPSARHALPTESPKIGLDNPDYVYSGARLDPRFEYRLRGTLGDAARMGFGAFSGGLGTPQGLVRDGYLDSPDLVVTDDGRFEIAIAREEPKGPEAPPNWLPMGEATNSLNVRTTLLQRANQRMVPLELERLGDAEAPSALDPRRFATQLARTGGILVGTIAQFLGWTAHFQSHREEIREIDPALLSVAQGDPNTHYFYTYWELDPDEALLVEFHPPEDCEYWNLQIGNHWLESLDFLNRTTHVNHYTAVREADGAVRIAIAGRDPGLPNWLDTAGHARGALALRWVGLESTPPTRTQRVRIPA